MNPQRLKRVAPTPLLIGLLLIAACGQQNLSDEAKAARIDTLYAGYRDSFPSVDDLSVEELVALQGTAEEPVLVDVRGAAERAVSMIPGAIGREEFEQRREEIRGRAVVAYCTVGYRSGLYVEQLLEEGWDARNLHGSILGWTHSGRDLAAAGQPVRRLHVYGSQWDLAPAGYETVW